MCNRARFVAISGIVLTCVSIAQALTTGWVHVGGPGNAPDTRHAHGGGARDRDMAE